MDSDFPSARATTLRPALLVAAGAVVLAVTAGIVLYQRSAPIGASETPAAPETQAASPQAAAQPPSSAAGVPAVAKPSFDVVRINPQGDAVMAGRAAPGSKVTIYDAGKPIGDARADENGDWVFTPSSRLPAGSRELTLAEQAPNGTVTKGDRSVVLVVPGPTAATQNQPPLAVLTGTNTAPSVLTGPAAGTGLAVGAMDYDGQGEVRFSGTAPPGAAVRLYVDNHPIGGAVADRQGKWALAARNTLGAGAHSLRLDQVAPDGKVTARLEQAFTREQMAALQLPAGQIAIRPGQNLWVIARGAYGQGTRYLVIFQANKGQIRDPNLIYPGQVFALPVAASVPAIPASSSTSK
jgi:nucleoid-associated protein YgaU